MEVSIRPNTVGTLGLIDTLVDFLHFLAELLKDGDDIVGGVFDDDDEQEEEGEEEGEE